MDPRQLRTAPLVLSSGSPPETRLFVRTSLSAAGFALQTVDDSYDANLFRERLDRERPDVVILDTAMGLSVAVQLCRSIRTVSEAARVPVLVVAAVDEVERVLESGAADVILRPILPALLLHMVKRAALHTPVADTRRPTSLRTENDPARTRLEDDLRLAIRRDELFVHYQPKVEIATGRITGFEALARWQHPELGLVSPARFIPIAEQTGLIVPIGELVLGLACAQSRSWRDRGLPPVLMGVNLSSVQFRETDLPERVKSLLDEAGLEPGGLELELTESALLEHADSTVSRLARFKSMGVQLSIDDFGTGYSSLSYLKRFPIDAIKIDQSFIRDVTTNPDDAAITTAILLMGKSLELKVVAEGVESRSQLAFLRVLGCDEAQGFYFSRPVAADEAALLLQSGFRSSAAA